MNAPSTLPTPTAPNSTPRTRRPRFQFSILGLLVLMLAMSMFGAPVYYFTRGILEGRNDMRLVGMTAILAAPLLLTVLVSSMATLAYWLGRR